MTTTFGPAAVGGVKLDGAAEQVANFLAAKMPTPKPATARTSD